MKRKTALIIIVTLLVSCLPAAVFAADAAPVLIAASPKTYTLQSLTETMTSTGTAFETMQINKLSDEAVAKSYVENVNSLEMLELASEMGSLGLGTSFDGLSLSLAKDMKTYFRQHLDDNYQAELNSIKEKALSTFYSMYQVQEMKAVSEETLSIQQETLKSVEKKYKLGSASRLEYLQAQMDLQKAQSDAAAAQQAYKAAIMGFNLSMNSNLLDEVVFKDEGSQIDMGVYNGGVEAAVKKAVQNRNEVSQMHFLFSVVEKNWKHAQLTSSSGKSAYISTKASYNQMSIADKLIEKQIEMEVRGLFDEIAAKKLALDTAETTVKLAEEAYNISKVSYNMGAATLTDLRSAGTALSGAKLGLVSARSAYEQAICGLNFAVGVGTSRISIAQ